MADISNEINDFKHAIYGKDVRNSMVSLAEKVNTEVETNTKNVNGAVETANAASTVASQANNEAKQAIKEANETLQAANTAKTDAEGSATAAARNAEDAQSSKTAAAKSAAAAQKVAEGLSGFNGAATSVKATDTQGLVVGIGGNTNVQVLLNTLAQKVANELISNTELATQLASHVAKTDIVQTESTATNKVPSSAYLKSVKDTLNSNLTKVETYLNGLIIVKAVGSDILGSVTIQANAASTITKAVAIVDGYKPIAVVPSQSGNNQCYYYSCVLDGDSIIAQIKNCGSESVTINPQARCIYVKK